MKALDSVRSLLSITRGHRIARRYFVVNGFDGALTMLGLIIGFILSGAADLAVVTNACLGAAIALGVSGVSSAYISEAAERRRALEELEEAMLTDLQDSSHGEAARWVPLLIALTNGAAPLLLSLVIITPLWLGEAGVALPVPPLYAAVATAVSIIFLLGVFLGLVAGGSWIKSGMHTLLVALVTVVLVYLFAHA